MPRKNVRIHYRRYLHGSEPVLPSPLSVSVSSALRSTKDGQEINADVLLRRYEDHDGASVILNGRLLTQSGTIFSETVRYNPETNIPMLMHAAGPMAELEIREATRPNDAEFLRGMAFFLITGDHFFVIEQDMHVATIERYLRWLLCTQTKTASRDARIQLVPRAFLNDDRSVLRDISSITLTPPPTLPNAFDFEDKGSLSLPGEGEPATDILRILKAAHFDTSVLERIAAEQHTAVEIKLRVTFKSGRRRADLHGDEALALLRNVPEDDLIIDGTGARKNRGVLERLSLDAAVELKGNILDRAGAWKALEDAAQQYMKAGWIE